MVSSGYTALRENVDYLWPIQFGSSAAKEWFFRIGSRLLGYLLACYTTVLELNWESDSMIWQYIQVSKGASKHLQSTCNMSFQNFLNESAYTLWKVDVLGYWNTVRLQYFYDPFAIIHSAFFGGTEAHTSQFALLLLTAGSSVCSRNWTRWWFQTFYIFTPTWGDDPIWRAYFSIGLKPPTSEQLGCFKLHAPLG